MTNSEGKTELLSLNTEEINSLVAGLTGNGEKSERYRAAQITDWVYKKQVYDYDLMTNLSKNIRENLSRKTSITLPKIAGKSLSTDGTEKYLLTLRDGEQVEIVIIRDIKKASMTEKSTLCISTQIGCVRGCSFCATAKLGLKRNLAVEEIVGQFLTAKLICGERKLTNLVFMGMGEPLDNYDNVCKAINIIRNENMISFSPRRITLSTCGVVPGIIRLSEEDMKVKLAVSLNSADQRKREMIMPVARRYTLTDLKKALLTYQKKNRRITIEYVMISNFNTSKDDAVKLMRFLGDISSKINLIAWNESKLIPEYKAPEQEEIDRFIGYLLPFSNAITYRKSKGADIAAACGQLVAQG